MEPLLRKKMGGFELEDPEEQDENLPGEYFDDVSDYTSPQPSNSKGNETSGMVTQFFSLVHEKGLSTIFKILKKEQKAKTRIQVLLLLRETSFQKPELFFAKEEILLVFVFFCRVFRRTKSILTITFLFV